MNFYTAPTDGTTTAISRMVIGADGTITINENLDMTGGTISNIDHLELNNNESSTLSDVAGLLGYDANFHAVGEAGANSFIDLAG